MGATFGVVAPPWGEDWGAVLREMVAVILAAGEGTRLRPLTELRPKPLCPVNNETLLDAAIRRVRPHVSEIAVNAHYLADQIAAHLDGTDIHLSVEAPERLGTGGALRRLRPWIDGRDVLVHNADAWFEEPLDRLVEDWSGRRPRLLTTPPGHPRPDFGGRRFVGVSLLPGDVAVALPERPSGLYEAVWRESWSRGELELVELAGPAYDCGTPSEYLAANLAASGGTSVIGPGCDVRGEVVRSVMWPGCDVGEDEVLVECVRASSTVTVPAPLDAA